MDYIRPAEKHDASRIAEILVFNNRLNFFPIFGDESFSFGEYQVLSVANEYLADDALLNSTYIYDDGIVRGIICIEGSEIKKLYVDPFFQNKGVGTKLMKFALSEHNADHLWALEKNTRARRFYARFGFVPTEDRCFVDDTTETLILLQRSEA